MLAHRIECVQVFLRRIGSKGGFRLYAPSALARVQWIAKLQDAGFSLQELRDFLRVVGPDGLEAASAAMLALSSVTRMWSANFRKAK